MMRVTLYFDSFLISHLKIQLNQVCFNYRNTNGLCVISVVNCILHFVFQIVLYAIVYFCSTPGTQITSGHELYSAGRPTRPISLVQFCHNNF